MHACNAAPLTEKKNQHHALEQHPTLVHQGTVEQPALYGNDRFETPTNDLEWISDKPLMIVSINCRHLSIVGVM
jgi:hypothetical protein